MYQKLVNQATIHRRIQSGKIEERRLGIVDLHHNFVDLPDKKQACEDIHQLVQDENRDVRMCAAMSLGIAFPYCTNEKQAWGDIIILIKDKENQVQHWAANSLCAAFPYKTDRKQAWNDIIQLVNDEGNKVFQYGIISLSNVFRYVDDKNKAWEDLILLTQSRNMFARSGAVYAMGVNFRYLNDKNQAWKDVHQLTLDESSDIQWNIAEILGDIFPYFPTENQILNDLNRLALDKISGLRISANYSLGRASIFKATEAENKEDFRKELENALKFFEKSADEVNCYSDFLIRNPASFCLPFYRSLYTLIFKNQTETEIKKILDEAKNAVGGSENKKKLLEAIEYLGNALKEAQNARDFNGVKSDLNAYRRYIERVCDLLDTTEEKAPGASRLIRKGLPIIDERIMGILGEIKEKTRVLCKQSKGTIFEENAIEANKISSILLPIRDPIGLDKDISNLQFNISAICEKFSENDKREACELIKKLNHEPEIEDKIPLINMILSKITSQMERMDRQKIEINNPVFNQSNIQIGDKNRQEINTPLNHYKDSRIKLEKSDIFKFITDPSTLAALGGFLSVELGTYFYPVSYNHLIGVFIAVVILIIGIYIKHQKTKNA